MMFDFLAGVVLTSKLCPKNLESTVYALLAGFQNYGNVNFFNTIQTLLINKRM
jgi:hypothetical protein